MSAIMEERDVEGQFSRTEMLLGSQAMERLRRARVILFGVGGVGGYVAEALARSGVGALDLVDGDVVSLTNLNRQIIALHSTLGQYKVDAARVRLADISPDMAVGAYRTFYTPDTADGFDLSGYDYVIDAVDSVAAKLELAVRTRAAGVPIISSMGAGNKLDPAAFEVADISKTSVCPLARVMRRELKKRGIGHLKVVYSRETPLTPAGGGEDGRRPVPGSTAFVPAAAGLVLAGAVIRDLAGVPN